MKQFTAKTLEEAIALACEELQIEDEKDLVYTIIEEKKGLFKKSATIEVVEIEDEAEYAVEYLRKVIAVLDIEAEIDYTIQNDRILIDVDSDHNAILIGRNGRTLQALTEITKLVTSIHFKKRIRLLIDVNNYKQGKYRKVITIAKRTAKEVQRSKVDATLDPMPADERRRVHNALTRYSNIATESVGSGHRRQIVIKYVEN